MKRLIIVADHSLVAHSIRQALKQTSGFRIVGVIDGRMTARDALMDLRPDVVLIDDMHGARADGPAHARARLREAADHAPGAQRLLLTTRMDEERLNDVFHAGAHAVLS